MCPVQAVNPANRHEPGDDPAEGLSIAVERHGDALVVRVSGELDLLTTPRLDRAAERALRGRPPVLVLDLTNVTFLGSAGMASLVAVRRAAGDEVAIRLATANPVVLRALEVVGLAEEFPLYATCEEALAG